MRAVPFLVLLSSLAVSGCPIEVPAELGDCADGTDLTFADASVVFDQYCTECHSSELSSPQDRQSATPGWDYDTAAAAQRDPDETWRRIYTENMPNNSEMEDADKVIIWEWYSCGAPE